MVDELWGERPPASAGHALQVHVSAIRKLLRSSAEEVIVRGSRAGYTFEVDLESVDATRFERLVGEGQRVLAVDPSRACEQLDRAIGLWRGVPLADLADFQFAAREADRLQELHASAIESLVEAKLMLADHGDAIGQLTALVAADPLRERPRRLLMLALYRAGRQAEALAAYRDACAALDEIGLQPGPELKALEHAILRHDPGLAAASAQTDRLSDRGTRASPAGALPDGVITLLFSDIEGSTRLLHEIGDLFGDALAEHDRLLRAVWEAWGGVVVQTEGDSFFVVFRDPGAAIDAAAAAQRALRDHSWPHEAGVRVRIGLHTGAPRLRGTEYWGIDVHYAARLCAAAHGGQVLLSEATVSLVDAPVEDLGPHALKDFPSARRIFHLLIDSRGSDCFAPPRTLRSGRTNLRDQLSSFVGRESELAQLRELVVGARLVTLTGAGGVGKTRLATVLAAELLDGSGEGVWFVDLASVVDGALVAATVAAVLGVPGRSGRGLLETLGEALLDRELLVVLDNCEQVVDAAAAFVAGLLSRCTGVSVLATSREPLRLAAERVYRVPSLSMPGQEAEDPDEIADSEAVKLFVERAAQQRSGFRLHPGNARAVARVCRRLDGIPLAIELGAVRLRSMSIDDLNTRLDHRFALLKGGDRTSLPRQQTLLALIEWSYQLLSEPEAMVLACLSVFAPSGFDLDAAEAVCGTIDIDRFGVLEHLDALVDKSLVQAEDASGATRYRLLETVREYASGKLAELGESETARVRLLHRDHYLVLAETARLQLVGPDPRAWLARLSLEHDNLRAALVTCSNDPDAKPGLRLAAALAEFWRVRGHAAEGAEALREQLERPDALEPTRLRGQALAAASHLLEGALGEYGTAVAYAEEALRIARSEHEDQLAARALRSLAWVQLRQGKFSESLVLSDEGVAIARALGDRMLLSQLISVRGAALGSLGRDARPALEEALDLAREIGQRGRIAIGLNNLGVLELTRGEALAARAQLEEAVAIFRDLGDLQEALAASINLGFVCCLEQDLASAARVFTDALAHVARAGDLESIGLALLGLAVVSTQSETAATLHGAADAVLEQLGYGLDPFESRLRDSDQARRKTEMGTARFQTAYTTGHQLPRAQAIAVALGAEPTADADSP